MTGSHFAIKSSGERIKPAAVVLAKAAELHTRSANSSLQHEPVVTQHQSINASSGRRIMILDNSRGKRLYHLLQEESSEFNTSVLAKSGAFEAKTHPKGRPLND